MMQAQCHCRECQYISGGAPNTFIAMPAAGFRYTKGQPKQFTRKDLERAVTREFCSECGTHLVTKVPGRRWWSRWERWTSRRNSSRRWRSTPATSRPSTRFPQAWRRSRSCRDVSADQAAIGFDHAIPAASLCGIEGAVGDPDQLVSSASARGTVRPMLIAPAFVASRQTANRLARRQFVRREEHSLEMRATGTDGSRSPASRCYRVELFGSGRTGPPMVNRVLTSPSLWWGEPLFSPCAFMRPAAPRVLAPNEWL